MSPWHLLSSFTFFNSHSIRTKLTYFCFLIGLDIKIYMALWCQIIRIIRLCLFFVTFSPKYARNFFVWLTILHSQKAKTWKDLHTVWDSFSQQKINRLKECKKECTCTMLPRNAHRKKSWKELYRKFLLNEYDFKIIHKTFCSLI